MRVCVRSSSHRGRSWQQRLMDALLGQAPDGTPDPIRRLLPARGPGCSHGPSDPQTEPLQLRGHLETCYCCTHMTIVHIHNLHDLTWRFLAAQLSDLQTDCPFLPYFKYHLQLLWFHNVSPLFFYNQGLEHLPFCPSSQRAHSLVILEKWRRHWEPSLVAVWLSDLVW